MNIEPDMFQDADNLHVETVSDEAGEIFRGLLSVHARLHDSPALIDEDGTWSYSELFQISTNLARHLARAGVRTGDLVVVVGERCASLVLSLLAVLMVGARFVVLDRLQVTRQRVDALGKLLPSHWLHGWELSPELRRLLPPNRSAIPNGKDALRHALEAYSRAVSGSDESVPAFVGGNARAYVVWTSGTTSAPKLVSTCHRPVTHFLHWYIDEFKFTSADRFSMLSGLSHDPLLRDIFTPLSVGAALHIPSEAERLDAELLSTWISSMRVSVIHLTPSMLEVIARAKPGKVLESVRVLAFGGEQLRRRHVAACRGIFPKAEIVNFYGTSETPQAMAYHRLGREAEYRDDPVPIGRGIPGVQLLLLRENQELCGVDEEGELYVRTDYLAEGYVDAPAETDLRFAANPLTADPGDRVFRTGDVGRYRADGSIVLIRRIDRQLKIGGNRVDLDSIEFELRTLASVSQAAVVFDVERQQIIAYVVRREGVVFSETQMREHVLDQTSIYAVPAKIVLRDTLPLSRGGKIDYAKLTAGMSSTVKASPPDAPTTSLTAELRSIWKGELAVSAVEKTDNFLDLGGSSISAHKIAARVRERLGLEMRAADLFVYPSIEEIEVFLRRENGTRGDAPLQEQRGRRRIAIESATRRRGRIDG